MFKWLLCGVFLALITIFLVIFYKPASIFVVVGVFVLYALILGVSKGKKSVDIWLNKIFATVVLLCMLPILVWGCVETAKNDQDYSKIIMVLGATLTVVSTNSIIYGINRKPKDQKRWSSWWLLVISVFYAIDSYSIYVIHKYPNVSYSQIIVNITATLGFIATSFQFVYYIYDRFFKSNKNDGTA